MAFAAEFCGGPFDGEIRVVEDATLSQTMPLPREHRPHPEVPVWAQYALRGDVMEFVCTGSMEHCLDAMFARRETE